MEKETEVRKLIMKAVGGLRSEVDAEVHEINKEEKTVTFENGLGDIVNKEYNKIKSDGAIVLFM